MLHTQTDKTNLNRQKQTHSTHKGINKLNRRITKQTSTQAYKYPSSPLTTHTDTYRHTGSTSTLPPPLPAHLTNRKVKEEHQRG